MKRIATGFLAALFLGGSALAAESARWVRGTLHEVDPVEGIVRIDDAWYAIEDANRRSIPRKGTLVDVRLDPREDGLYVIELTPARSGD